jgi:hypothetical protein
MSQNTQREFVQAGLEHRAGIGTISDSDQSHDPIIVDSYKYIANATGNQPTIHGLDIPMSQRNRYVIIRLEGIEV